MELDALLTRLRGVRKSGDGYSALCPAHDDHGPSLSVKQNGNKLLIKCFAGCEAEAVVKALGLHMRDLYTDSADRHTATSQGCTLQAYAGARRLDVQRLRQWGVSQSTFRGKPCLLINYYDKDHQPIRTRRRLELNKGENGDHRFNWCRGDGVVPYGLWRLNVISPEGYVLLVEGESDCHACWQQGIPAIGVPGASTWKSAWADYLDGLKVYLWHEGDDGARALARAVAGDLPATLVLGRPEGFKDLSEAHAKGIDISSYIETAKERAIPISSVAEAGHEQTKCESLETTLSPNRLEDLAPWVEQRLSRSSSRENKASVASAISEWMLRRQRLIVDTIQDAAKRGRPYVVDDDNSIWPIERYSRPVELLLFRAGLNATEPAFLFVLKALEMKAVREGKQVSLSAWSTERNSVLYVSCGPTHLVRVSDGNLDKLPNGTDGIWFDGTAAYPSWNPESPVAPQELAAFRPALTVPQEVPLYTPEVQSALIGAYAAILVSGLRPTLIMAAIGQKGGGKTQLGRAYARLLLGPGSDVTSVPGDKRDYAAMTTNQPLVVFDNVDTDIPPWFADELAGTATGKQVQARELYTNGQLLTRRQTAAVYISTRTAAFCRPDIAERLLPIFTKEFQDDGRIADADLLAEIDADRDCLLSWCAAKASQLLCQRHQAPQGLPLRFVDFSRMFWAYMSITGQAEVAAGYLQSLRQAQALAVGEGDPLTQAIAAHFDDIASAAGKWSGMAVDLVRALEAMGADLPRYGGGKAIARQLRESRPTLALMGITLGEHRSGSNTIFDLCRKDDDQGNRDYRVSMDPPHTDSVGSVERDESRAPSNPVSPVSPPGEPWRDVFEEEDVSLDEIPF